MRCALVTVPASAQIRSATKSGSGSYTDSVYTVSFIIPLYLYPRQC